MSAFACGESILHCNDHLWRSSIRKGCWFLAAEYSWHISKLKDHPTPTTIEYSRNISELKDIPTYVKKFNLPLLELKDSPTLTRKSNMSILDGIPLGRRK